MITTAEQGTKTPSVRQNAEGRTFGPHASEKVLEGGPFSPNVVMEETASPTPHTRKTHHLVHTTFDSGSGEVVFVPNLDKRNVGGLSKR